VIVAVTGGTGFIGKKLVSRLTQQGDSVRLLTRSLPASQLSSVEIRRCDLLTAKISDLAELLEGVDVLYHCAGQLTNAQTMQMLHVDGTQKLVEAASGRIKHWVQLSSVGVYGRANDGLLTEKSALQPVGLYEMTKAESDQIVIDASHQGGFSYSVLRPSNVFGGAMTNQSLFGMIAMLDRGMFFYIGEPGASANYIHVDNVIEGLIRCATMKAARGQVFNLSDYCTLEEFVSTIARKLGCNEPWLRLPEVVARLIGKTLGKMPHFPLTNSRVDALVNRSQYSIELIQRELGYEHIISMERGLQEMIHVYQQRCGIKHQ
jgi:nucleoside-diphosphate-sugar epimerase